MSVNPETPLQTPANELVTTYGNSLNPQVTASRTVLDIGCGEGSNSLYMAQIGYEAVLGIDIDPQALDIATQKAAELGATACTFAEMSLQQVEKIGTEFNVVMANEIFHTMQKAEAYDGMQSMQQVTARGGVNIISGYMITPEVTDETNIRRMFRPGELFRIYERAGWRVTLQQDKRQPVQRVDGKEQVFSKSCLIAHRPRF